MGLAGAPALERGAGGLRTARAWPGRHGRAGPLAVLRARPAGQVHTALAGAVFVDGPCEGRFCCRPPTGLCRVPARQVPLPPSSTEVRPQARGVAVTSQGGDARRGPRGPIGRRRQCGSATGRCPGPRCRGLEGRRPTSYSPGHAPNGICAARWVAPSGHARVRQWACDRRDPRDADRAGQRPGGEGDVRVQRSLPQCPPERRAPLRAGQRVGAPVQAFVRGRR